MKTRNTRHSHPVHTLLEQRRGQGRTDGGASEAAAAPPLPAQGRPWPFHIGNYFYLFFIFLTGNFFYYLLKIAPKFYQL